MRPNTMIVFATLCACSLSAYLLLKLKSRQAISSQYDAEVAGQETSKDGPQDEAMRKVYQKMSDDFAASGLNVGAIKALQPWFHGVTREGDLPWPKKYDQMDEVLPPNAVRLLVIPFEDSPAITSLATAVAKDIASTLPSNIKVFSNARTHYHCTVFHTSYPTDPRPDPLTLNGGEDLSLPAGQRRGPTQDELHRESKVVQQCVAASPKPVLELERVVVTSTGTLLITWLDRGAVVTHLRSCMKHSFPGATAKQANIVHTTLWRIVSAEELSESSVAEVRRKCEEWTSRLRGKVCSPSALWWIHEEEFSTIVGPRQRFALDDREE